jgi:hypothetical protein
MGAEEQLELRPSKQRWILIFLGSAGFVAAGVWMIRTGGPVRSAPFGDATFWGWFCVVFFGLGVPVSLLNLITTRGDVLLTPDGFSFGWWRRRVVPWDDVVMFGTRRLGYAGERVVYQRASGRESLLPDTYGMRASELAVLMTDWRQRHANRSS